MWIFGAVAKNLDAVFRCSLEPAETARPLEVPQWMFDPAACCRVHLKAAPAVDCEALLELKRLLARVRSTSGEVVLQIEHPSSPSPGGADETLAEPTTWSRPDVDIRLKKRIIRTLIHEVVVDRAASEVILVIHWKGGAHTEIRLPRRRRSQNSMQTAKETVDAVKALARICPDPLIASVLNRNGLRTGRGNYWTQERVTSLRSHHQIPVYSIERRLEEGWMNLTQAAQFIGMSPKTLRLAVERGEIVAEHPLSQGPWIFNRDTLKSEAVTSLIARVRARCADHAIPMAQQGILDLSMA